MSPLSHDQILALHKAAVEASLSRLALLAGVDAKISAQLTIISSPGAQILSDLTILNEVDKWSDGSEPLRIWLKNAAALAEPQRGAHVFRATLDILEAPRPANSGRNKDLPRDRLLDGIRDLPDDSAYRIGDFIDAYAGTSERSNAFCGREADVDKLQTWLADDTSPSNLIVTAPAGRGKSALLVRFALELAQRDDVGVVFVPLSLRFDTHQPDRFLRCVVARLAMLHGQDPPDLRHMMVEALQRTLLDYLKRPLPGGRLAVILLDGLDEAVGWSLRPGLLPSVHDRTIRIIVSARHQPDDPEGKRWLRDLGWTGRGVAECVTLPLLESRDVEAALGRLPAPLSNLSRRPEIVFELTRLSIGEPLTLWLMLEDLKDRGDTAAAIDVSELRARSPGLEACFEEWWTLQRKHWGNTAPLRERAVRALLELLTVANGGLTRADLLVLLHDEIEGSSVLLDKAIEPLSRLIHGDGRASGYVPAHPGLAQHLHERLEESEVRAWRDRLVGWSRGVMVQLAKGDLSPAQVPRYVVHNRATQLREEGASVEQWMSLATRAWHDAWRAHQPGPSGFLGDLDQVWSVIGGDSTSDLTLFAEEVQCALIRGSVGSVLANVRTDLMGQLLHHRIWTPEQALAYVREAPIGHDSSLGRGALVRALAPHTPPALLPQLFDIACSLVAHPSAHWTATLQDLLPYMAKSAPNDCIAALRRMKETWNQASLLLDLAPHLTAPRREEVLQEAWEIAVRELRPGTRTYLLTRLATLLPEPEKEKALRQSFSAALEIPASDAQQRYRTLAELSSLLPEDLQAEASAEALKSVSQLKDTTNYFYALEDLVQVLPVFGRNQAISIFLAEIEAAQDLSQASKRWQLFLSCLPEAERAGYVPTALDAVARIVDESDRYDALISLLFSQGRRNGTPSWQEYTPRILRLLQTVEEPWRRLRIASDLKELSSEEAWQSVESVWPSIEETLRTDDTVYLIALSTAVRYFVPIERALTTARCARAAWARAELLSWVAPRLCAEKMAPVVEEAFLAVMAVETPRKRAEILLVLLSLSEPSQQEAIFEALREAITGIEEAFWRSDAWMQLADYLLDPWRSDALDAARVSARAIDGADVRLNHLLQLVEMESADRRDAAFDEGVRAFKQGVFQRPRSELLTWLSRLAPESRRRELLREALESTHEIGDIRSRADTMTAYAAHLSAEELLILADRIDEIQALSERTGVYVRLLERCPGSTEDLFHRALAVARKTGDELPGYGTRASHLGSLLNVAPGSARRSLSREVLDAAREDLARVIRAPDAAYREDLLIRDSGDTRSSLVDGHIANALARTAPWLPAEWLFEALGIAATIATVHHRGSATLALAARLDEIERARVAERVLAEELPVRLGHHAADVRRRLALTLAPLLPEPRRSEVVAAAAVETKDPPPLSTDLPDDLLTERLDLWLSLLEEPGRHAAWPIARLVAQLPPERRARILKRVLDYLPSLLPSMQPQILVRLLPYLAETWIDRYLDVAEISNVGDHQALALAAPRFNPRQLDRAIALLQADTSRGHPHDPRIEALALVAAERLRHPDPPVAELRQSLRTLLRSRAETRADVLATLSSLAPLIGALGGVAVNLGVVRAIRRVGAWWP